MANPWPRETFVIPGDAGQVARTINMIKVEPPLASGFLEQQLGVAQALSPFKVRKVRAPPPTAAQGRCRGASRWRRRKRRLWESVLGLGRAERRFFGATRGLGRLRGWISCYGGLVA